MKIVIKVMVRSLALEFYRQNAAFFGLLILIFFGFIRGQEHILIGKFLVANPIALPIVLALWGAYLLKNAMFLIPTINKAQYQFLEEYATLERHFQIVAALAASTTILLPVLLHGMFLLTLSILQPAWQSLLMIIACIFVFVMLLAIFIHHQLCRLPREKVVYHFYLFRKAAIPHQLWFGAFLLRKEMMLFLLTKLYACLLIIGTTYVYQSDTFDLRLLTAGVLLAVVGNVALMHKLIWFQHKQMSFAMNLPLGITAIFRWLLINILMLIAPEILFLFRYYPLDFRLIDVVGLLLFAISICALIYGGMLRRSAALSDFVGAVFWFVVVSTILLLFAIHPLMLGLTYLCISGVLVRVFYHKYEWQE
jgi:hypothetical protein